MRHGSEADALVYPLLDIRRHNMLPCIDWTACCSVTSLDRLEGTLQIPLAYSPAKGTPTADRAPADLCMSNTAEVDKDPCGCAASAMAFARQRMFGGGKVRSSEMLFPFSSETSFERF